MNRRQFLTYTGLTGASILIGCDPDPLNPDPPINGLRKVSTRELGLENPATTLADYFDLSDLELSVFGSQAQVLADKEGNHFALPRTLSEIKAFENGGHRIEVDASTNPDNLYHILGSPARAFFDWVTNPQSVVDRFGRKHTVSILEHFSREQLRTISARFGPEKELKQDFVNATMDYFNQAVVEFAGTAIGIDWVTARSVRGTRWPIGDHWEATFPRAGNRADMSNVQSTGILHSYHTMNWGVIGDPVTYHQIEQGTPRPDYVTFDSGVRNRNPAIDECSQSYEQKVFSTPVITVQNDIVAKRYNGNMPVKNIFYGDSWVHLLAVYPHPTLDTDMALYLKYKPSETLINTKEIGVVYNHISAENGSYDITKFPQEGSIVPPNKAIAVLSPNFSLLGRHMLDYHLRANPESSLVGNLIHNYSGAPWAVIVDQMLEHHQNDHRRIVGVNHPAYNKMIQTPSGLQMDRSTQSPCAGSSWPDNPYYHLPTPPQ